MTHSRLLRLPAEIRTRIYNFVLVEPTSITVGQPYWFADWKPPPLLQTCSQIRHEAGDVYYCGNAFQPFRVDLIEPMVAWLKLIGPRQRSKISRIYLADRYFTDEARARPAIGKYRWCLTRLAPGLSVMPCEKVFYVSAWPKGRKSSVWLNMPKLLVLREDADDNAKVASRWS